MDLMQALRILRKRWILTVTMLVVVLASLAGVGMKLPRAYQAQSMVVLLASKESAKSSGGNPYLAFYPSLTFSADVLKRVEMAPRVALSLANHGYTAKYTVTDATDTSGPVLVVAVTGSSRPVAEGTLLAVTNDLSSQLSQLQNGVTADNRIQLETLSVTTRPSLSLSKMARPLVVVVIFGLLVIFAVPLIVDSRSNRRRAKRLAASGQVPESQPVYTADAQPESYTAVRVPGSQPARNHASGDESNWAQNRERSGPRIR